MFNSQGDYEKAIMKKAVAQIIMSRARTVQSEINSTSDIAAQNDPVDPANIFVTKKFMENLIQIGVSFLLQVGSKAYSESQRCGYTSPQISNVTKALKIVQPELSLSVKDLKKHIERSPGCEKNTGEKPKTRVSGRKRTHPDQAREVSKKEHTESLENRPHLNSWMPPLPSVHLRCCTVIQIAREEPKPSSRLNKSFSEVFRVPKSVVGPEGSSRRKRQRTESHKDSSTIFPAFSVERMLEYHTGEVRRVEEYPELEIQEMDFDQNDSLGRRMQALRVLRGARGKFARMAPRTNK